MLTLKNISLRRGSRYLLENASCTIKPKQRVGLIGANGSGKSSLFSLILDQLNPDEGEIELTKHLTIAHLSQETPALKKPAVEYVIDGDQSFREIEQALIKAEHAGDGLAVAQLHEELDKISGYQVHARAGALLNGLGFSSSDQLKAVADFSGGWRVRLNLAQTLMCRSDLLLLDEPTNHLDLETIIWLERWLINYQGTLIIIAHDREFLDNIATHIIHIEHQKINSYTGNYSAFEKLRAEKLALVQAQYEKQERVRAHLQSFVDRFRYKASKAAQAQSRIKMLEKMPLIACAHVDSEFQFEFKPLKKAVTPLLTLENVEVGYHDKPILKGVSLSVGGQDRIGLLGPNGAGKSTFIKLLAGELQSKSGIYEKNKGMMLGYFAQHQLEQLDPEKSALAHLQEIEENKTDKELRSYLGTFGFTGDHTLVEVKHFSGGEKARLVLALIVWQQPNLLLLDEPTNHFDIEMREALTLALQNYQGAMIIISHDRHLLRATTDELYLVYDRTVKAFSGSIDDYEAWLLNLERAEKKAKKSESSDRKAQRIEGAKLREQKQPLVQKSQKIEKQITLLREKIIIIEQRLAESEIYDEANKDELVELLKQQGTFNDQISHLEAEWLSIEEALYKL